MKAQRGGAEVQIYSFFKLGARWDGWSTPRSGQAILPPGKKPGNPLSMKVGEPHGRSGRVRKISLSQGFDPRTFQAVASRYTD